MKAWQSEVICLQRHSWQGAWLACLLSTVAPAHHTGAVVLSYTGSLQAHSSSNTASEHFGHALSDPIPGPRRRKTRVRLCTRCLEEPSGDFATGWSLRTNTLPWSEAKSLMIETGKCTVVTHVVKCRERDVGKETSKASWKIEWRDHLILLLNSFGIHA